MRFALGTFAVLFALGIGPLAAAEPSHSGQGKKASEAVEVTADKSLEWYQEQSIYVARGHAKAVRGDLVIEADLLTAHEREKAPGAAKTSASARDNGDIDKMTAEGGVVITDLKSRTTGDKAVYDFDMHAAVVSGGNLRYETEKMTVTARDALEYYDDRKIAVARGHATEDEAGRHVEGDVLTAEFHDGPDGQSALSKVTADGHVAVVTKGDVARGDRGVYDAARNMAIISGHVRITRPDGTQLSGDVGEVDFATGQSRLLNSGHGRVRALLPQRGGSDGGGAAGRGPEKKS